jgi:ferredoxin
MSVLVPAVKDDLLMSVRVDRARCEGNAVCAALAPDIFDLDDEGTAAVIADEATRKAPGFADAVRRASYSCPREAILLED